MDAPRHSARAEFRHYRALFLARTSSQDRYYVVPPRFRDDARHTMGLSGSWRHRSSIEKSCALARPRVTSKPRSTFYNQSRTLSFVFQALLCLIQSRSYVFRRRVCSDHTITYSSQHASGEDTNWFILLLRSCTGLAKMESVATWSWDVARCQETRPILLERYH